MLERISIGIKELAATRRLCEAAPNPFGYVCLADYPGASGYGAISPAVRRLVAGKAAK